MKGYIKKYFVSGDDLKIIKAIITLIVFVLLAKLAGLFKEVAVAWRFGISVEVDAYNFTFSFVQWPISLFGAVIGATLIPLVSKIKSQRLDGEINVLRSEIFGLTILLSLVVMVAFYLVFNQLLSNNVFNLDTLQLEYIQVFLNYLVWVIPLGFLAMLFSAWTMSSQRHTNTFLEAMPALMISFLVLVFGGAISLAYGIVIGFTLQTLLLGYFLYKHKEIEWPKFTLTSKNWSPLLAGLSFMLIGQFFMSLISLVDQYFAAGLGVGAISTLSYAEKILAIVLSLGVVVIGRAVLPVFSDAHNEGKVLKSIAIKWASIMFVAGVLASFVFYNYAGSVVRVIFERGAFSTNDTEEVANLLQISALQIPFYIGGMVLSYLIISLRQYKAFVYINGILLIAKVLSLSLLLHLGLDIISLPISTVIVYLLSFSLCLIFLFRYYK